MKINFKNLFKINKPQQKRIIELENKAYEIRNNLLKQPSNDLFEKSKYMQTETFWDNCENIAHYSKGQYLADGGKWENLPESTIAAPFKSNGVTRFYLSEDQKIIRGYEKAGTNSPIVYIYEINPENKRIMNCTELNSDKIHKVTLYDNEGFKTKETIFPSRPNTPKMYVEYIPQKDLPNTYAYIYPDNSVEIIRLHEKVRIDKNGHLSKTMITKSGNTKTESQKRSHI